MKTPHHNTGNRYSAIDAEPLKRVNLLITRGHNGMESRLTAQKMAGLYASLSGRLSTRGFKT